MVCCGLNHMIIQLEIVRYMHKTEKRRKRKLKNIEKILVGRSLRFVLRNKESTRVTMLKASMETYKSCSDILEDIFSSAFSTNFDYSLSLGEERELHLLLSPHLTHQPFFVFLPKHFHAIHKIPVIFPASNF